MFYVKCSWEIWVGVCVSLETLQRDQAGAILVIALIDASLQLSRAQDLPWGSFPSNSENHSPPHDSGGIATKA